MPQGSFGTRLLIAAKAAIGLFSEPSASQAFHLLSGVYPGASGAAPERGTREILEGYSSMPWLRAVAQKISHSVASTQWQLYAPPRGGRRARIIQRAYGRERRDLILRATAEEKLKPIESHLLLDALASANAFMVGPSLLRISSVHVDLVGETFWIKERNGLGAPIAFFLPDFFFKGRIEERETVLDAKRWRRARARIPDPLGGWPGGRGGREAGVPQEVARPHTGLQGGAPFP